VAEPLRLWPQRLITIFGSRIVEPVTMTQEKPRDDSIASADEFEAVLAEAVEKAIKSDVDVRGAWEFRTRGSTHDWEVEIIELARYHDDEDE
jgi:hypothetical protein